MVDATAVRRADVYQLHASLAGVSPMIWRRILVSSGTSIAELHTIMQLCFGWDDEHLHRFLIHGGEYGINRYGGFGLPGDPYATTLASFGLRATERFSYQYDFIAGWKVQLRLEQILAPTDGSDPVCVAGRRCGPPPQCVGPWDYLQFRGRYNLFTVAIRLGELIDTPTRSPEEIDELREIRTWLGLDRLDRRTLNRSLIEITTQRSPV